MLPKNSTSVSAFNEMSYKPLKKTKNPHTLDSCVASVNANHQTAVTQKETVAYLRQLCFNCLWEGQSHQLRVQPLTVSEIWTE